MIGALLFAAPAFAQVDDTHESRIEIAEKLVEETLSMDLAARLTDSVLAPIIKEIRGRNPGIDPARIAELMSDFERELETMAIVLSREMPSIFADHFTTAELHEIYDFQTSEVGKKMLRLQPDIMGSVMPKIAAELKSKVPGMHYRLRKKAKEMNLKL